MGRIRPELVVESFAATELQPSLTNDQILGLATAIFAVSCHTNAGWKPEGEGAVCMSSFCVTMNLNSSYISGYNDGWCGKPGSGEGYDDAVEARRLLSWKP